MYDVYTLVIDISADTQKSEAIQIARGTLPAYLVVPASFDGTGITVEVSFDNQQTWDTLEAQNGGSNPYTLTVRASRSAPSVIPIDPEVVRGLFNLRFVSNAEETADRSLVLVVLRDPTSVR